MRKMIKSIYKQNERVWHSMENRVAINNLAIFLSVILLLISDLSSADSPLSINVTPKQTNKELRLKFSIINTSALEVEVIRTSIPHDLRNTPLLLKAFSLESEFPELLDKERFILGGDSFNVPIKMKPGQEITSYITLEDYFEDFDVHLNKAPILILWAYKPFSFKTKIPYATGSFVIPKRNDALKKK